MRILATIIAAGLAGSTASADVPPPPVIVSQANDPANTVLMDPQVETTCGGEAVLPVYSEDLPPLSGMNPTSETTDVFLFSVASDGRVLDVRPEIGDGFAGAYVIRAGRQQVQANLAAWRFEGARADCRLTVRYLPTPLASADPSLLMRYYAVTRDTGPVREAVAQRLSGARGDCMGPDRPRLRRRTLSFPDFSIGERLSPGGYAWTVVRWDVGPDGRSHHVETLGSSGDAAFDAETRRAAADSTSQPGEGAIGCVHNFFRTGPALPAPPLPDLPEDPLRNCPESISERLIAVRDQPYPEAFRRRSVEGWAAVRFDLATWGETGNVEVVEAQPAAAFGDMARNLVRQRRAAPSPSAGVRCVTRVQYRLADDSKAVAEDSDAMRGD